LSDGRRHVLHFNIVGAGAKGELSVVIVRDIGSEKEQAAHLEIKHKKEAVNAVAGALMHNVNQSLTVIMAHAQIMNLMLGKGLMKAGDVKNSLQDIVRETTRIAEVLKNIDRPSGFVTETYMGGVRMLDIKRSAGGAEAKPAAGRSPRACIWLESSYTAVLNMLLAALDSHEGNALRHARRTSEFAAIIGRHMGLDDAEIEIARSCGLLHDIGKIGIPEDVLRKPSALSGEQMDLMKKHTEIGYDLLRNFPFPREEADVARSHHERWNGSGYPQGLAGIDIHPMARIVAVCDAFDALGFERVYHRAVPVKAVAAEIIAGAGTQFDPEVIEAFEVARSELESLFESEKQPKS